MPKRFVRAENCFDAFMSRALFALTLSLGEFRCRSIIATLQE